MLNNIMLNKKNLLQQCITVQKGRKKVNTHMKGTTRYPKMIQEGMGIKCADSRPRVETMGLQNSLKT